MACACVSTGADVTWRMRSETHSSSSHLTMTSQVGRNDVMIIQSVVRILAYKPMLITYYTSTSAMADDVIVASYENDANIDRSMSNVFKAY